MEQINQPITWHSIFCIFLLIGLAIYAVNDITTKLEQSQNELKASGQKGFWKTFINYGKGGD